jgi:hypothetical protein
LRINEIGERLRPIVSADMDRTCKSKANHTVLVSLPEGATQEDGPFGSGIPAAMTKEEERELREQLARLQQEHRDLDAAISALETVPGSDLLQVQRLKKRKLYLRDRISHIEDQLTPDIIA